MRKNDFETKITLTKTAYILKESDYNDMLNEFYTMNSFAPISGDLNKDINFIRTLVTPYTYVLNVVFNKTLTINCDSTWNMKESPYDVLVINGAGSTIKASFNDKEEDKWVVLSENMTFYAQNITLEGFNTVIENMGGECLLDHVNFFNNKMDYLIDRDWGAAILNTGIISCIGCCFKYNYAKNGGAIFNQGLLSATDCIFSDNKAYGKGDNICVGDGGQVIINGKLIESSSQSSFVYFAESLSLFESVALGIMSCIVSFAAGAIVGFITANPVAGIAIGTLVGTLLGGGTAALIISKQYDVNFNRLGTVFALTIGSQISGAAGGFIGGYYGAKIDAIRVVNMENELIAQGCHVIKSVHEFSWFNSVSAFLLCGVLPGSLVGISYCTVDKEV